MRETKVKTADLLVAVRENMTKHIEAYKEACAGYCADALKGIEDMKNALDSQIEGLSKGVVAKIEVSYPRLPVPESHEKDYTQVIRMLEMSVDETTTLKSDEFACYVMDDWGWKESFMNTNSMYAGKGIAARR